MMSASLNRRGIRWVLFIALGLIFGLGACSKKEEAKPVVAKQPAEAKTKADEKAPAVKALTFAQIMPDSQAIVGGRVWDEGHCLQNLAKLKPEVEKHQFCKQDSDCVGVKLGCPFGCPAVLNKIAPVEALKTSLSDFHANCSCMQPCRPGQRVFFCNEGRCAMRIEALQK